jgi:hypothetical protein
VRRDDWRLIVLGTAFLGTLFLTDRSTVLGVARSARTR